MHVHKTLAFVAKISQNAETMQAAPLDRNSSLSTRGRVRVLQVTALGRAPDDAVVRGLEVEILHTDGIVPVCALAAVWHVGP